MGKEDRSRFLFWVGRKILIFWVGRPMLIEMVPSRFANKHLGSPLSWWSRGRLHTAQRAHEHLMYFDWFRLSIPKGSNKVGGSEFLPILSRGPITPLILEWKRSMLAHLFSAIYWNPMSLHLFGFWTSQMSRVVEISMSKSPEVLDGLLSPKPCCKPSFLLCSFGWRTLEIQGSETNQFLGRLDLNDCSEPVSFF